MHHRLAERRHGIPHNAADKAHEKACGEQHHARLVLLDNGGKRENDDNSSGNSQ